MSDWIKVGPNYEMICERCGYSYKTGLPIPVTILQALMKQWGIDHKACTPKKQEVTEIIPR